MGYRSAVEPPKVIIFDWDDTICPSSFVDQWHIDHVDDLPPNFQKLFTEVARCAAKCLHEASKYGEVIIITNSDDGWVKYSCERFVPRLLPFLDKYRIVSARTEYEKFYPGQPLCWKAAAFAHEVNELYESYSEEGSTGTSIRSLESTDVSSEESFDVRASCRTPSQREIISFGDSMEERTAVRIVSDQLSATSKSVMFIGAPTPIQIIGQLNMLSQHMKFVCEHQAMLDLEISPDQAQRYAETYLRKTRGLTDQRLVHDLSRMLIRQPTTTDGDDINNVMYK